MLTACCSATVRWKVSSRFCRLYFVQVFYCLLLPALYATCSWCNPASFFAWVFSSAHHILLRGWATVGDAQFITPLISIATGQNIWDAFQSAVVCKRRPLHPVGWSRSTSRFIMLKPLSWKNQASIDKSYREIFWSNQLHWFSHVSSAGLSGELF